MRGLILTANLVGWPIIQIGFARWMLRRPAEQFTHDSWLTQQRRWERKGVFYRRLLAVQRWKHLVPDGAPWLGGLPKKRLVTSEPMAYKTLLAETRRAELAHWYMMLCTPIFFLWNPLWASSVMGVYGVLANFPCILIQRFNRIRLLRLVASE